MRAENPKHLRELVGQRQNLSAAVRAAALVEHVTAEQDAPGGNVIRSPGFQIVIVNSSKQPPPNPAALGPVITIAAEPADTEPGSEQ